MILSNEELKNHIYGAVYFEEDKGIIPYRFTKEQIDMSLDSLNEMRHRTATGIRIDFYSDTQKVNFKYKILTSCSNNLYKTCYFDVYVDDLMVLHQGEKNIDAGTKGEININLIKEGSKRITIYLPGSCSVEISELSISLGSEIQKVVYDKNVIFFGDSITHAAYLDFTSMSYVNILSRKLNYNFVNQAIGGDDFNKNNLMFLPDFKPDSVFVAYGTNDWRWANESSPQRIEEYFNTLKKIYSHTEINVILPIWRGDINEDFELKYSFADVRTMIKETAEKYGATIIDGYNFIPNHELLLRDGYLHPNESGFIFYADSMEKCIKNNIRMQTTGNIC